MLPDPHAAPTRLKEAIRAAGHRLGFVRVGFTTAEPDPEGRAHLAAWRAAGHAGELDYLLEPERRDEPRALLATARTVIAVALPHPRPPPPPARGRGRVAAYALGPDYHDVVRGKLDALAAQITELVGRPVATRSAVDAEPLLEHGLAMRAGVGFTGRHTLTIVPGVGSYLLLGELLLELELPPDVPLRPRCGSCTRCLDVCPTGAFLGPYRLDARRCISYLTIELRGAIPRDLRPLVGTWVFGCDRCQEVCPYNAGHPRPERASPALPPRANLAAPELVPLLHLGSKAHRRLVRGTVLHRVSRPRLARNAAVALGNAGEPAAIPSLAVALAENSSPLVRGHAAWALGRLVAVAVEAPSGEVLHDDGAALARAGTAALARARDEDPDATVRDEAALALSEVGAPTPSALLAFPPDLLSAPDVPASGAAT